MPGWALFMFGGAAGFFAGVSLTVAAVRSAIKAVD